MVVLRRFTGLFLLSTGLSAQVYLLTDSLRVDQYSRSGLHPTVTINPASFKSTTTEDSQTELAGVILVEVLPTNSHSPVFQQAPANKIPVKVHFKTKEGTIMERGHSIYYVEKERLERSSALINIGDISERVDPIILGQFFPPCTSKQALDPGLLQARVRLAIGRGEIERAKNLLNQYSLEIDPETARAILFSAVTYCYPSGGSTNLLMGAKFLIENGSPTDITNDRGQTLLHLAAKYNCSRALPMLLDAGLDPNRQDNEGETPLNTAVRRGHVDLALKLVSITDVNLADSREQIPLRRALDNLFQSNRPLCQMVQSEFYGGKEICVQEKLVLALVNAGSNVNVRARGLKTPFRSVVQEGSNEMLEFFLEAGADINERNGFRGETPLHFAAKEGREDVVTLLLDHGADPTVKLNIFGRRRTAAQVAEEKGYTSIANTIARFSPDNQQEQEEVVLASANLTSANIDTRDHRGRTALYRAASRGDLEEMTSLLNRGANPNIPDYGGRYPLTLAARKGKTEVVKILLGGGADPNLSDSSGRNALHMASDYNRADMIPFLFESGANPNALRSRLSSEETPLMISVRRGNTEAALALINGGADPNFSDSSGNNALHVASLHNQTDMIPLLLESGTNPNTLRSRPREETPFMIAVRRENTEAALALIPHVDISAVDPFLLHEVVRKELTPLIRPLIERGLDPNRAKENGQTALHQAARRGDEEAVRILLEAGVNRDPKEGRLQKTPLFLAAGEGHAGVVRLLLRSGANPDIRHRERRRREGHPPIEEARKNGHMSIVEIFQNFSFDESMRMAD